MTMLKSLLLLFLLSDTHAFAPTQHLTRPATFLAAKRRRKVPPLTEVESSAPTKEIQWTTRPSKATYVAKEEAAPVEDSVAVETAEVPVVAEEEPIAVEEEPAAIEEAAPVSEAKEDLVARVDTAVSMTATDVRQLVSGSTSPTTPTPKKESASSPILADATPTSSDTTVVRAPSGDDSLEQLLQDAREMQTAIEAKEDEGESSLKKKASNALSTLVTVDFFVVVFFLLWFLLGVFSSAVLGNDAIQIAFNSNFQAFVQPALGILMIAAIGSAVFKEEEEEQN